MTNKYIEQFDKEFNCPLISGDYMSSDGEPLNDEIKDFIRQALSTVEREAREDFRQELYSLNWIEILSKAIFLRPTSWNDNPVREWRNASDQIVGSLIQELEDKGYLKTFKERVELSGGKE